MNEKQKRIEASVEVTLVETVADTKKHGQSFSAAAGVDADTDPHTDAQSFFRISLWLTQLIAKGNKLSIVAVTEGKGQTRPSPNRLVEVVKDRCCQGQRHKNIWSENIEATNRPVLRPVFSDSFTCARASLARFVRGRRWQMVGP
ncbi:hypothetical protein J6590_107194 [Homalodisca vitripennis]|nr:hypothetical protein J6590_107194 [Homalodisca vitripennis]